MERREHRYKYIPTIRPQVVIPDLHDVWGTPYPRDPEMLRGSDPRRLSGYDVESLRVWRDATAGGPAGTVCKGQVRSTYRGVIHVET